MSNKVMIDLDVLTVALWHKKDPRKDGAKEFLERVKGKDFEIYTPIMLLEQLNKWKNDKIVSEILSFLKKNSERFIGPRELEIIADKKTENLVSEIMDAGKKLKEVKESDLNLVIYASVIEADFLVTFDKKHLLRNEEQINKFLSEEDLPQIKIVKPGSFLD